LQVGIETRLGKIYFIKLNSNSKNGDIKCYSANLDQEQRGRSCENTLEIIYCDLNFKASFYVEKPIILG